MQAQVLLVDKDILKLPPLTPAGAWGCTERPLNWGISSMGHYPAAFFRAPCESKVAKKLLF